MGLRLLKDAVFSWLDDHAPSYSAAIAFYTIFSFIPLSTLAMFLTGLFFGEAQAAHEVQEQFRWYVGDTAAGLLGGIVFETSRPGRTAWGVAISAAGLLLGAMAVFGQVQVALNAVWKVPGPRGLVAQVRHFLRRKLMTGAMVLIAGPLFVLVTLLASLGRTYRQALAGAEMPQPIAYPLAYRYLISLAGIALLLAMVYKILPDARIRWRDVWLGSLATAGAIVIGQGLISLYLSRAAIASAYGAAGSLAVLLLWVYYNAMVFLLGAEFTRCLWAKRREEQQAAALK